jgi:hypothetical protein
MKQHVIGDDGWNACARGEVGELIETQRIVRAAVQVQRQIGAVPKSLPQPAKMQRACLIGLIGHEHRDQVFTIGDDIRPIELASRLAAALLAE